jgi:hypothetical protein
MSEEIWKVIREAPSYEINSEGVVRHRRLQKETRIRKTRRNEGYVLLLTRSGSQVTFYIDDLMATYFDGVGRDPDEVWRTVSDAWGYDISNLGRVRNRRTGRILTPYLNNRTGQPQVTMMDAGFRITRQLHTLMKKAFG